MRVAHRAGLGPQVPQTPTIKEELGFKVKLYLGKWPLHRTLSWVSGKASGGSGCLP